MVANGDVLNTAMRVLVHQRMLGQFDRILEMITEKMGLKVLGGVRRYSFKKCSYITYGLYFFPTFIHYYKITKEQYTTEVSDLHNMFFHYSR